MLGEAEIVQRIGRRLLDVMPQDGLEVTESMIFIGHSGSLVALATLPDGSVVGVSPDWANADDAELLRTEMYKPDIGTWLSCAITVDSNGRTSARFDPSGEPKWQGTVPSPAFFERELKMFPRDDAHIPGWFRAGLDGTLRPE